MPWHILPKNYLKRPCCMWWKCATLAFSEVDWPVCELAESCHMGKVWWRELITKSSWDPQTTSNCQSDMKAVRVIPFRKLLTPRCLEAWIMVLSEFTSTMIKMPAPIWVMSAFLLMGSVWREAMHSNIPTGISQGHDFSVIWTRGSVDWKNDTSTEYCHHISDTESCTCFWWHWNSAPNDR